MSIKQELDIWDQEVHSVVTSACGQVESSPFTAQGTTAPVQPGRAKIRKSLLSRVWSLDHAVGSRPPVTQCAETQLNQWPDVHGASAAAGPGVTLEGWGRHKP